MQVQYFSRKVFARWGLRCFVFLKPLQPVKRGASRSVPIITVSLRAPEACVSFLTERNLLVPCYHADAKLWPDVEDPALEHPMSARLVQILDTYQRLRKVTGKEQPLLKPARYAVS